MQGFDLLYLCMLCGLFDQCLKIYLNSRETWGDPEFKHLLATGIFQGFYS